MKRLIKKLKELEKTPVKRKIQKRMKEFKSFTFKDGKAWFSELCFCLLTANWKAKESIAIQDELGFTGFCTLPQDQLQKILKEKGHRFYPQRSEYILKARRFVYVKSIIKWMDSKNAREWLVKNIKGLGYKEASHFLRNVGYDNLAILDRHIINLMVEHHLLKEKPKTLTRKKYLEIEKRFQMLANKLEMSPAELDLYMWYLKTGKVLK